MWNSTKTFIIIIINVFTVSLTVTMLVRPSFCAVWLAVGLFYRTVWLVAVTSPSLWLVWWQEAELRLVKFLPDILALQRDLVKRFQNVTDLTCRTIADFLHCQKAGTSLNYTSGLVTVLYVQLKTISGIVCVIGMVQRADVSFVSLYWGQLS